MKHRFPLIALLLAGGALALLVGLVRGPAPDAATASSHREAPLIADDPTADNTDVYAFVDPSDPTKVNIIANYIPLEEPAGGPNFHKFDDDVLYEIKIDNDGDAKEDVAYQFRFETQVQNPNTFLYNTGPITSLNDPDFNVRQLYSVTRLTSPTSLRPGPQPVFPGRPGGPVLRQFPRPDLLGDGLATPPVNIGPRSTPNYEEGLARAAVHDLGGGVKVFAGQRDDPFFVDLGSIFDLAGLRPFNNFHLIPLPVSSGVDGVAGFNTHTIAIQVPTTQLRSFSSPNIGIYASASRPRLRILSEKGKEFERGQFVQVSRLGNPLINEVVIPLGDKDRWNFSDPADDAEFAKYYVSPELAKLINLLYPALPDTPESNRTDLSTILLTGIPGVNFTGSTLADLLRLNTSIPPSATPSRLGALEGDLAGFPNGRRLADDVTDIEIRAFACGYGGILQGLLGLCNLSPNNGLGDGVDANEKPFLTRFPYVATPHQGYEHSHHGQVNP